MASTAPGNDGATRMEGISPTEQPSMAQGIEQFEQSLHRTGNGLDSLGARVDPDNSTTVTDFLDFTEHLPSDMIRSLTLIGNLDQRYTNASRKIDDLTRTWGQIPSLTPEQRPSPIQLREDISEQMNQAVSSRVFAHAEAIRMSENVNRHYNKAKALLAKLQGMMDNYPTDDAKSPVQSRSPQMVRSKLGVRAGAGGEGGQKVRRQRVPRITVPGEVLAPYDLEYESFTDESDVSSDEDSDTPGLGKTPGAPRIKIVSSKPPKTPNRVARPVPFTSAALSAAAAANAAALLNPPPENAVIGSPDAPWLQLTQYELAKLRKRMKKNATWTPSETMIARELKALNRGPDAFREAKKKAEEEGKVFEPPVPKPVVDDESGTQQLPAGAISVDSLAADEVPTSNRGMKLNEAKKLKREALAKQAADEAEESARKMEEAAKRFLSGNGNQKASASEASKEAASAKTPKPRTTSRSQAKRKREPEPETTTETQENAETPSARPAVKRTKTDTQTTTDTPPPATRPQPKRTKTETPVPPPQYLNLNYGKRTTPDIANSTPLLTPGGSTVPHSQTPVPIPIPPRGSSSSGAATSPTLSTPASSNNNNNNNSNNNTVTTSIPAKLPHTETPVPLPNPERRQSMTPVLPPIRETIKRETRGDAAKRNQQQQQQQPQPQKQATPVPPPQPLRLTPAPEPVIKQSSSRAPTPQVLSVPEKETTRRPGSRGKAMSQEPQPSLAADRPRRASTARNTPAPEARQPSKRTKRPAPGVVSVTRSGGNSAVGKRKAAPKKKTRTRKDKGQETYEEDDEGNPIDPNETRYCSCNGVSFSTMIQCENSDVSSAHFPSSSAIRRRQLTTSHQNCKGDWFHLKCVGLEEVPARTTKWYCPECRVLLNIGERGEVNARGVKT